MTWYWIALVIGLSFVVPVYGETLVQSVEGGMDVEITYPDEMVAGREGMVSILVKNNGWEEKRDISFVFSSSGIAGLVAEPDSIEIERLAEGGSYGENISLVTTDDAGAGIHFLNIGYSQILVANNETPQEPLYRDIAIPITVKGDPTVTILTKTPESIFADAEFPIEVEVTSQDIDITDVRVMVIPPKDIEFRGETMHSFSKIEKGTPVGITSQIITPAGDVNTEYKLPFEIIVQYTDDVGGQKEDSQTVSVVLRPRTFMELTADGGIWVGNFFIAPYVSLGTIIGVPAGAIVSLLIRRRASQKK